MKCRRFLSGLLFGMGCALSFLGLIAIVLPGIENPQLQLILTGFQMHSSQPSAEAGTRFMQLVFAQNWHFLYLGLLIAVAGAMLLLRFTPKAAVCKETSAPYPIPQPVQLESADKPNPYARSTYLQPPVQKSLHSILQPEPILERNIIEIPEPEPVSAEDVQPYFSPRFSVESRAMETETGAWSQSGSRILIRSIPETPVETEVPNPAPEPEPIPSAPAAPPSSVMTSPRIRSTMGKHTH